MIFCIYERVKWVWVKENGELRYERVPINTTSVYKCIASSRTDRRILREQDALAALYSDNNLRGDRTFRVDNDSKHISCGKWSNFCKLIRVTAPM